MKKQLSDDNLNSASGGAIPKGKEEEFYEKAAELLQMWNALSEKDRESIDEYYQEKDAKKKKR